MEAKNKKTSTIETVISSITQLRLVLAFIVAIFSALLATFIVELAFDDNVPQHYFLIVLCSTAMGTLISQSLEIFRLTYKPWMYISLSFVQALFGVGFVLVFAYYFNGGIEGYLVGVALAMLFSMLFAWYATRQHRYWWPIEYKNWGAYLKFGLPLLPAGLIMWVMQLSDRWFVMNMLGSYETGIYSVATKFALIMTMVIETFRKAWWPIAMDVLHKDEGKEFFRNVSLMYVVIGATGVVLLTLISPYLLSLLAAPEYYEAWRPVGVLAFGSLFYGFFLLSGLGIFYSKKTYLNILVYSVGGGLNILLNVLLIPRFGIMGAAIATIIGLFIAVVIGMVISTKYYPIRWRWAPMLLVLVMTLHFVFNYVGVYES